MKSAQIHAYGDPSVITTTEIPRPTPGPGEVLIRVAATSFNPTETYLRSGALQQIFPLTLPYTPGWDVAGTIEETGDDTIGFAIGDQVIGRLDNGGAAAQYVRAEAALLTPAPTTIPLAQAASLPVAGLTAWQAVFDQAPIKTGQRVLINGAGGGVGGFAIQLAKYAGAEVIATASPRSTSAVLGHGAHQVIDYTWISLADALESQVDTILNLAPISPEQAAALVPLVKPGGVIVSIATPVDPDPDTGVTGVHMVARNDVKQLAALVELVDSGVLSVDVSAAHPLTELAHVHRLSEAGRIRGKVIILL